MCIVSACIMCVFYLAIHVYICLCWFVYIYGVYICANYSVSAHPHVCVHMHVSMCMHVCIYVYMYVCACMHMRVWESVHAYMYVSVSVHMHARATTWRKPKRVSFLVSTYLCHMAILLHCLGKQHSKLKVQCSDHCTDSQPFVRNDFIPNGVLPISDVWRSWKIVICMSASRCSLKYKNK